MAEGFTGAPTVEPRGEAPSDYQNIQPRPEQFGGLVARGAERAGAGLEQGAEAAWSAAQFRTRVDADDMTNGWFERSNKLLYGDPSKPALGADGNPVMGPDGKPLPDTGYLGKRGADALYARPDIWNTITKDRQETAAKIGSPQAKFEFDNMTRRMMRDYEAKIGQHADTQEKERAVSVNAKTAEVHLGAYLTAASEGNLIEAAGHRTTYINAKVQEAQARYGFDPEIEKAATLDARRDLLKAEVEFHGASDPNGAMKLLEENRDLAGPLYPALHEHLRSRASTALANDRVAVHMQRAGGNMVAGGFAPSVTGALNDAATKAGLPAPWLFRDAKTESGGNPNARTGSYKGVLQLSDREMQRYVPGGNIYDARDNALAGALKMKAEDEAFTRATGRDVGYIDHYMIHQQGLAGYMAHLADPDRPAWQNMAATAEGREKGERWAKAAIWGNIPDRYKSMFGSVDNVTSRNFIAMWQAKAGAGAGALAAAAPARLRNVEAPAVPWSFPPEETIGVGARAATAAGAAPMVPNTNAAMRPDVIEGLLSDPELQANPEAMDRALRLAEFRISQQQIADNQTRQAKHDASDTAADKFIQQFHDMRHSANPDYVALAGAINHNPDLTWETRERLMNIVGKVSGEEQALNYGPGYLQARHDMFSPADAPNHINDISTLIDREDITLSGLNDLATRLRVTKGDINRAAIDRRVNSFLEGAKKDLSFEEGSQFPGYPGLRDSKGEHIFHYRFMPNFVDQADKLAEEAQRTGDRTKLDKFLSAENVEKMVHDYRNPSDMAVDKLNAERVAGANVKEEPNAPLPPAPPGVEEKSWQKVVAEPPIPVGNAAPLDHMTWNGVLKTLLANANDPLVRKQFDMVYARGSNRRSADLLAALGGGAAEVSPTDVSTKFWAEIHAEQGRQQQTATETEQAHPQPGIVDRLREFGRRFELPGLREEIAKRVGEQPAP